jgi:hypothetical protein
VPWHLGIWVMLTWLMVFNLEAFLFPTLRYNSLTFGSSRVLVASKVLALLGS